MTGESGSNRSFSSGLQPAWRQALLAAAIAIIAGCTAGAPAGSGQEQPLARFIAFGDSGYEYAFLDPDDREEGLSPDEFVARERADWIEDGRAPEDFKPPPMHRLENGGTVDATGLHVTAAAMKDFCRRRLPCDWAVMLGDNIYPRGADGIADELRFETLFTRPFADLGSGDARFRIYSVLGNHDWYTSRAGAMSEIRFLESHPPFYMDDVRYAAQPLAGAGSVELFALDTYVLLAGTGVLKDRLNPDGSEMKHDTLKEFEPWAVPATDKERNMVAWLERSLRESRAEWKIVMGHHPIWSSGGTKFEEARVLRRLILPILCRYADAYLAGHDHTLEVHTDDCSTAGIEGDVAPLMQVVSGAASKQRGVNRYFVEYQDRSYPEHQALFARGMTFGFAHITLYRESAEVRVLETGDGTPREIFRTSFARRSGALAGPSRME